MGILDRVITLLNGTKPTKPTVLQLRGVNSDTFDIDVGATRNPGPRDPMEINGYRFDVISLDDFQKNGGKWDRARVEHLGFEDGGFIFKKNSHYITLICFFFHQHFYQPINTLNELMPFFISIYRYYIFDL